MARKPRSKTATRRPTRSGGGKSRAGETAHERRVRQYLEKHPGATKAQARGHKPKEHATRERRAKEAGRLTERERAAIKRFATKNAKRRGLNPGDVYDDMASWAQAKGFKNFDALRSQVTQLGRRKSQRYRVRRRKLKSGRYSTTISGDLGALQDNLDAMDEAFDDLEIPDREWLWYH